MSGMRRVRVLVLALVVLSAGCVGTLPRDGAGTPAFEERTEFTPSVVEVVDGDTVEVRFADGHTENVRLLGVDTPEVHVKTDPPEWEGVPDTEAGQAHLRDWGHRASEFVRSKLEEGEQIRLVVDESADRRGSYDRLLVYLYDDGKLLNLQLIKRGYARLYESEFGKRERFAAAEQTAREGNVGVWNFGGDSDPRPAGGRLAVETVHADAAGNDDTNENDEYVVFENVGTETLDLSGWQVQDEAGRTYTFPEGFELAPGETVVLHTGSGTDTASDLYWGANDAIWNNGGDTVSVYDADGDLVLEDSY